MHNNEFRVSGHGLGVKGVEFGVFRVGGRFRAFPFLRSCVLIWSAKCILHKTPLHPKP